MMNKQAADGLYVDDPDVKAKYTDINVLKLEERLLNRMPTIWDIKNDVAIVQVPEIKNPKFSEPAFIAKYGKEYIPSFF